MPKILFWGVIPIEIIREKSRENNVVYFTFKLWNTHQCRRNPKPHKITLVAGRGSWDLE